MGLKPQPLHHVVDEGLVELLVGQEVEEEVMHMVGVDTLEWNDDEWHKKAFGLQNEFRGALMVYLVNVECLERLKRVELVVNPYPSLGKCEGDHRRFACGKNRERKPSHEEEYREENVIHDERRNNAGEHHEPECPKPVTRLFGVVVLKRLPVYGLAQGVVWRVCGRIHTSSVARATREK